ncbi:MAG: flavodoxin-dependent (E)-4-hydroxy-3-methylbut-2-enyl-diphosphate synthase [Thermodesulfovibrionales bacterium]|nr:flavodoxin-dependent (E)-4-hydroxy-3-methylbut-2-enyl-diphosphate synthase [Thermodesulfovibrionales bacterium]
MIKRKITKTISVGNVIIGGGYPISVQSMTKTDTKDIPSTIQQIKSLQSNGCEIVRLAVPDMDSANALFEIKKSVSVPLIADIHFDWRLALKSIDAGIDGLRINPGNIGAKWKIKEVVNLARNRKIPIRIGVNAGSLEKDILNKYGHPTIEAIVESAERHMFILQELDFNNFKVSLKASDVMMTIGAYRLFSERHDYPLHIGISEAGPSYTGVIKSSIGLGILLSEGIGDTMRVSLTAPPEEEVRTAFMILRTLGLKEQSADIVSCPTCGRCQVNIRPIAQRVEEEIREIKQPIKVAVMGCAVNGPGEAREADIGIACGKGEGFLFKKGKVIKTLKEEDLLKGLLEELLELKTTNCK